MADPELPRTNVERNFDTGQVDLTTAATVYKVLRLHGNQSAVIKAKVGNGGLVFIGKKDVTSSLGFELSAGESQKFTFEKEVKPEEYIDIYAVGDNSGDDVCYTILP